MQTPRVEPLHPVTAAVVALLAACAPGAATSPDGGASDVPVAVDDTSDLTPDLLPDGTATNDVAAPPALAAGGTARVTAADLNVRAGPGTSNMILTSMPCGTEVTLLAAPSMGWWNVSYMAFTGWSSGAYLVADSAFDPSICMPPMSLDAGASSGDGGATMPGEIAAIFQRARYAVGYSYYWGHGAWGTDGADHGTCSGSCPSCAHTGSYGADCSGFVAKVWQIPGPSPLTTDLHPYSTHDFYFNSTHWTHLPTDRSTLRAGDALTYNSGSEGHIMLFESGSDPYGNIWTYEARACATGIVHNLRVANSSYQPIRREGL